MSWSRLKLPAILFIAIIFFILFHERQLSGYDPASFVLAIKYGYCVAEARPHGPGYPGFYLLWKAIQTVTRFSPHGTILAANLGFSLLAIALTYFAARRFYNEQTGLIASLLTLTNPLLLYFGNSTELYAYDAAFSAFVVILLVAPPLRHSKGFNYETGLYFLYGILGSFRLSSFLFTIPVFLISFALRYARDRSITSILQDSLAIFIGVLAWFVPFLVNIGGWAQFVNMLRGVSDLPSNLVQNLGRFVPAVLWMVNILFIIAAMNARRIWTRLRSLDTHYLLLLLLMAVPSLFFTFRYYEKGYLLLLLAPVAILGARLIEGESKPVLTSACVIIVNLLLFGAVPFIPPPPISFLNHRNRTSSERFASFLLRETSFFAPTLSHLRASDNASEASDRLTGTLENGSMIVIDNSAAQWAFARTLQAEHSGMTFLAPPETDTMLLRRFWKDSLDYSYTWDDFRRDIRGKSTFYYLTDRQLSRVIGSPPGFFLSASGHIALFYVPHDSFDALRNYDRTFFNRGEE